MKEEYEKMLSDNKVTMKQLQEYVSKNFPEKLYRYRTFKHGESEISNGDVHMTKSGKFNDPFDCRININEEDYMEHQRKFLSGKFKKEDKCVFDMVWKLRLEKEKREQFKVEKREIEEMIRVSCFSEINNSILMWSHYADCHKGFCIEYDISKMRNNKAKQCILPVVYSDNWYDITQDLLCPNKNQIWIKSCLYKYKAWEYEKEWRIIYPEEHNWLEDEYNFNFSEAITAIYLGVNIEQKNLESIKEWTKDKNIKIYQMKTNEGKYELYSKEIVL